MTEKKNTRKKGKTKISDEILPPAPVEDQALTDTLRINYMPYAMSVIYPRDRRLQAVPEKAPLYHV